MNYIEEIEQLRLTVIKNITGDSSFIEKLSEGAGVGMKAILSLIHQSSSTRRSSIKKIKAFLDKDK